MTRSLPVELLAQSAVWDGLDCGSLVVACSGGRDSVALALAAVELLHDPHFCRRFSRVPELVLWHYDHGLRPDSELDRRFVEQLAVQLGVRCRTDQMAPLAAPGNIEAFARRARYGSLHGFLNSQYTDFALNRPARAVTAHHMQDQAETVLHHLLRGTRLRGARGIAPQINLLIYRPWLQLPPGSIEEYLKQQQQVYCTDPTNLDTTLTRNWLRHEVLPRLLTANPQALEHLAQFADEVRRQVSTTAATLDGLGLQRFNAAEIHTCLPLFEGELSPLTALVANSSMLASGQLYNIALSALEPWLQPTSIQLERLYAWSLAPQTRLSLGSLALDFPHQQVLLIISTTPPKTQPRSVILDGKNASAVGTLLASVTFIGPDKQPELARQYPAKAKIRDFVKHVGAALVSAGWDQDWHCMLPPDTDLPLCLRTWQGGDRIELPTGGTKKVGDIFTDAKVPRQFRAAWILLADAKDQVLWVPALADSAAMYAVRERGCAHLVRLRRQL